MATSNATAPDQVSDKADHWSAERVRIAAQATHQIESLLYAFRRELSNADTPDTTLLMSMTVRLKELNSVAMSMLDKDDLRETAEMRGVAEGSHLLDPRASRRSVRTGHSARRPSAR